MPFAEKKSEIQWFHKFALSFVDTYENLVKDVLWRGNSCPYFQNEIVQF